MIRKPPNSPYSSVRLANTCMLAEMLTSPCGKPGGAEERWLGHWLSEWERSVK